MSAATPLEPCRTLDDANAALAIVRVLTQSREAIERKIQLQRNRIEQWARRELLDSAATRLRHGVIGFRPDGSFYCSPDPLGQGERISE